MAAEKIALSNGIELRLVSAEGIPEGSLVSIRVGATRRQANLGAQRPYRFAGVSGKQPMKVDIYAPIAQARLMIEPQEASFPIQLGPACGFSDMGSEAPRPEGNGTDMAINVEVGALTKDTPGQETDPALEPEKGGSFNARRQNIAPEAQPYFEQHHLVDVMQALLQGLIQEKPSDPYAYMVKVLQNSSSAIAGKRKVSRPQSATVTRTMAPPAEPHVRQARPGTAHPSRARNSPAVGGIVKENEDLMTNVDNDGEIEQPQKAPAGSARNAITSQRRMMLPDVAIEAPQPPPPDEIVDDTSHGLQAPQPPPPDEIVDDTSHGLQAPQPPPPELIVDDASHGLQEGDMAYVSQQRKGRVLQRTTTDVLVQTAVGEEEWHAVEDVERAACGGAHDLLVGDVARICSTHEKGKVLERTTSDLLIRTDANEERWHAVEDLEMVESTCQILKAAGDYSLHAADGTSMTGRYTFDPATGQVKDEEMAIVGTFTYDPISTPLPQDRLDAPADANVPIIAITDSEIMTEIQKPENDGAFFVIPSQLNGVEYPTEDVVVRRIEEYKFDNTGGPRGQLAVHPAPAQFMLDNAACERQENGISSVDKLLFRMKEAGHELELCNGYLKLPEPADLAEGERALEVFKAYLKELRPLVMSEVPACGLNASKCNFYDGGHKVSIVYASAVPLQAYVNYTSRNEVKALQKRFADAMLVAQYYGALQTAASRRMSKEGKGKVFLMPLGGGVFNNSWESIAASMARAVELLTDRERAKLDIRALTWNGNPQESKQLKALLGKHRKLRSMASRDQVAKAVSAESTRNIEVAKAVSAESTRNIEASKVGQVGHHAGVAPSPPPAPCSGAVSHSAETDAAPAPDGVDTAAKPHDDPEVEGIRRKILVALVDKANGGELAQILNCCVAAESARAGDTLDQPAAEPEVADTKTRDMVRDGVLGSLLSGEATGVWMPPPEAREAVVATSPAEAQPVVKEANIVATSPAEVGEGGESNDVEQLRLRLLSSLTQASVEGTLKGMITKAEVIAGQGQTQDANAPAPRPNCPPLSGPALPPTSEPPLLREPCPEASPATSPAAEAVPTAPTMAESRPLRPAAMENLPEASLQVGAPQVAACRRIVESPSAFMQANDLASPQVGAPEVAACKRIVEDPSAFLQATPQPSPHAGRPEASGLAVPQAGAPEVAACKRIVEDPSVFLQASPQPSPQPSPHAGRPEAEKTESATQPSTGSNGTTDDAKEAPKRDALQNSTIMAELETLRAEHAALKRRMEHYESMFQQVLKCKQDGM